MKRTLIILLTVVLALTVAGCGNGKKAETAAPAGGDAVPSGGLHHAEITVKDYGTITVELNGDAAPITVDNFMKLAKSGFYNGLTFHRVVEDFVMQGGDPNGDGSGGPGYTIAGEFADNGFSKNDIPMEEGVIAMARFSSNGENSVEAYNSAGSQFFIMHQDAPHLDGDYAAFGKVIEGMDVVDAIASVRTDYNDRPRTPQKMKKVTVDTFGVYYPEPEKV